jgi:DNA-binding MarR family transcriptional regulator
MMAKKNQNRMVLEEWIQFLRKFRKDDAKVTVLTLQVFIEIGRDQGASNADICERLGISPAAVARTVHGLEETGLDLVKVQRDRHDFRKVHYFLNKQGLALIDELLDF